MGSITVTFNGKLTEYPIQTGVNDRNTGCKDVILCKTLHRGWNWSITNTHHKPGIGTTEIAELVEHGCDFIMISTRFGDMLQLQSSTVKWLIDNKIKYIILNSLDAIKLYNKCNSKNIGLLLHSTC